MKEQTPTRRHVLATGSTLVASALAGCSGANEGPSNGGSTRTTGDDGRTEERTSAEGSGTGTSSDTTSDGAANGTNSQGKANRRTVRFESTEGTEVVGTLVGSGNCAVVFVPQINMDRESWSDQANAVAEMGHVALAIDEDPNNRAQSVVGAIDFLRQEHGVRDFVLVGASTGGEAVVAASVLAPSDTVGGVVTLSAAGGDNFAARMPGRNVFVVAEGDDQRFIDTARTLHRRAPDPKRLVVLDGSAHGQRFFESPHAERVATIIRNTISSVCGS